jgi:thioredoxin-like negative regulator of GroEL
MLFLTTEQELTFVNPVQVLYFYRPDMVFHDTVLLRLHKVEREHHLSVRFFAIDVSHFTGLTIRFSIGSIPTILALKKGNEIMRICGIPATEEMMAALADI